MNIREIAEMAGVSPASVSLVINHRKGVSEETRQKVLAVIRENGYSAMAKKRRAASARLMIVKYHAYGITEENQGFIASILDKIESECRRHGDELVTASCAAEDAVETLRGLMREPPDGVIFVGSELDPAHYGLLDLIPAPTLILDNAVHYGRVDSLTMANAAITAEAVDYLYGLGHRDIGYIQFNVPIRNCEERYAGFLRRMSELNLPIPAPCPVEPKINAACESMRQLIRSGKFIMHRAFVADNDTVAIGASRALIEAGYRCPEDFSIIGVDDIPFSAVCTPPLTTMRVSRSTLGILAVKILRLRLKNPDWPPMHLEIDGQRIARSSCQAVDP